MNLRAIYNSCFLKICIVLVFLLCIQTQSKAQSVDSLKNLLSTNLSHEKKVDLYNEIAKYYWGLFNMHYPDSQKAYISKAVNLAKKIDYQPGLAEALFNQGKFEMSFYAAYDQSTSSLLKSLSLFEILGDSSGVSRCLVQLGVISYTLQNYEEAISNLKRAIAYSGNNIRTKGVSNYLIALSYSECDSFATASKYFNTAIKDYLKIKYQKGVRECNIYLGKMLINQGNFDSAIVVLNKAVEDVDKSDSAALERPYVFLSTAYLQKRDLQKAIFYGEESYRYGNQTTNEITIKEAAKVLHQAYFLIGNCEKAYYFLNSLNNLKDSLYDAKKTQRIAEMKAKFEFEKQSAEQKANLEKQKIIRNFSVVGFFIFFIIAFILLRQYRAKHAANNALRKNQIQLMEQNEVIIREKHKSDNLLLNILPFETALELKEKGKAEAKLYEHVTVLFTDFKDFTQVSEKLTPTELVQQIDYYFSAFDQIIERNHLEKIKTIGDSYMAVCGLPVVDSNHAINVIKAGIEINNFCNNQRMIDSTEKVPHFDMVRIGIHSGSAVAGIVGTKKFAYDIWGDTVNTASRMESSGEPGKINISGATYELVKNDFKCTYRGKIQAKNKGDIDMYFVEA